MRLSRSSWHFIIASVVLQASLQRVEGQCGSPGSSTPPPPQLTSFTLNLNILPPLLLLTFNTSVTTDCGSGEDDIMYLQNGLARATRTDRHVFSSVTCVHHNAARSVLSISVPTFDWEIVNDKHNLATTPDNTFLRISEGYVRGTNGVYSKKTSLQVRHEDFTPRLQPSLTSFSLNLTSEMEELILTFDFPINPDSCTTGRIALQSSATLESSTERHIFSNVACMPASVAPQQLLVVIPPLEWQKVLYTSGLANSPSNTFISIEEGFGVGTANGAPNNAAIVQVLPEDFTSRESVALATTETVITNSTNELDATTDSTTELDTTTDFTTELDATTYSTTEHGATTDSTTELDATTDSTTELGATTDSTTELDATTDSTTELGATTDSTTELGATTDSTTELDATTDSTIELGATTDSTTELDATTDSTIELGATTDTTTELDATTDSTIELGATTDSTTELDATTDSTVELGATTDFTTELDATTDSTTELDPTTDSTTELGATTDSTTELDATTDSTTEMGTTTDPTIEFDATTDSTTEVDITTADMDTTTDSTIEQGATTDSTFEVDTTTEIGTTTGPTIEFDATTEQGVTTYSTFEVDATTDSTTKLDPTTDSPTDVDTTTTHIRPVVPQLTSFSLNLNLLRPQFLLTFDSPVTAECGKGEDDYVAIQNGETRATLTERHTFFSVTCSHHNATLTVLMITVPSADWELINSKQNMATTPTNTFVRISRNYVRGTNGVHSEATSLQIRSEDFTPRIQPSLTSFSLNLTSPMEVLILTFDSPIDPVSCTIGHISIQNGATVEGSTERQIFSYVACTTAIEAPLQVNVTLSITEWERMTATPNLATTPHNTFINIEEGFGIGAMNGAPNTAAILQVSNDSFVPYSLPTPPSMAPPQLISFSLNLNLLSPEFLLTFDSPVTTDCGRGEDDYLAIQNGESRSVSTNRHTFSLVTCTYHNTTFSVISITTPLANWELINSMQDLATTPNNTFIRISSGYFHGVDGRPSQSNTFQVLTENFFPRTPPCLTSFFLNLTSGMEEFLLTFDAMIDSDSCATGRLSLQNGATPESTTERQIFSEVACIADAEAPMQVHVIIPSSEWQRFSFVSDLATSPSNTFLNVEEGFSIGALNGAPNHATILQVSPEHFVPRNTPPVCQQWMINFNLQVPIIVLVFSEAVNLATFETTGVSITFVNRMTSNKQTITLSGGNLTSLASNTTSISLVAEDSAKLRSAAPNLANISLTLAKNTVSDRTGLSNRLQDDANLTMFATDTTLPRITGFDLDLNARMVLLEFTEQVKDFNFSLMYLTHDSNVMPSNFHSLQGSFFAGMLPSGRCAVQLSTNALNDVLSDVNTCTSISNCFIFWARSSYRDLSNNSAEDASTAQQVSVLIADTTAPQLNLFTVDLDSGSLMMAFSEPIDISSLLVPFFSLVGGGIRQHRAINGSIVAGAIDFSTSINIALDTESLNFAKSLQIPQLAIQEAAVLDAAQNQIDAISELNARLPSSSLPDETSPQLIRFRPDPSTRSIVLTFDEFVSTARWNGSQLSMLLQVYAGDVEYSGFTGGTLSPVISNLMTYTFSDGNYSSVFSSQYLEAFTTGAVVLRAKEGMIADLGGNPLLNTPPMLFSTQQPDVTSPSLRSFDFDMDAGLVQITFSEPVYIQTDAGFQLRSGSMFTSYAINVVNASLIGNTAGPLPVWDLWLSTDELNALKLFARELCSSTNNTFMGLLPGFVMDRSENQNPQNLDIVQVTNFTADSTSPEIEIFSFNANTGSLFLQFSEPVDTSFDFSLFYLSSSANSRSIGVNITGSTISSSTANMRIGINVALAVLNNIKINPNFCTRQSDCYLHYEANSFTDAFGNSALTSSIGMSANEVVPDVTPPSLTQCTLDLNTGIVTLSFDEPVDFGAFNSSGLTFVGPPSVPLKNLSDAQADEKSTLVRFLLSLGSLNEVKRLNANAHGHITLAVLANVIQDFSHNPTSTSSCTLQVYPDTTSPQLVTFVPISNTPASIVFIFNEFVNSSTLLESQMEISLTTRLGSNSFSGFSGGISSNSDNLIYTFSSTDYANFSDQYSSSIMEGSLFLTIGPEFIFDLSGNVVAPLLAPLRYSSDNIRPRLLNYTLDMDTGSLQLSFSEPVFVKHLAGQVQFQNTAENPESVVVLSQNGTLTSESSATNLTTFLLGHRDLAMLNLQSNVATSKANTFLLVEDEFATDLGRLPLSQSEVGLQVYSFVSDTTGPALTSFSIDLNQGQVVLNFSEAIVVSTLDTARIYLLGYAENSNRFNLSASSFNESGITEHVTLSLFQELLNLIKLDTICSTLSNCRLFLDDNSIADVSGNTIRASTRDVTISGRFVEDYTHPNLSGYSMDLNAGSIVLTFSEPILDQQFNPAGINLTLNNSTITLENHTVISMQSSNTVVELLLEQKMVNHLKSRSNSNVSLSISSDAAFDTSSLSVTPLSHLAPKMFVPDTTSPDVTHFLLDDASNMGFTLIFNEYVNPESFKGGYLRFKLKNQYGLFEYYDLSSSILVAGSSLNQITLTFSSDEKRFANETFQLLYQHSIRNGSICLYLAPSFISDVSGNRYASTPLVFSTNYADKDERTACFETCPANTFLSAEGCDPCHHQCAGYCRGSTNTDCLSCLEHTLVAEDGSIKCVKTCPFGKPHDSITAECQLQDSTKAGFILSSVIAAILLIFLMLCIVGLCLRGGTPRGKNLNKIHPPT